MSESGEATLLRIAEVRRTARDVLQALSLALFVAAGTVAVLMLVVWFNSGAGGAFDFPGRHLFLLLPLVTAGITLWVVGDRIHTDF